MTPQPNNNNTARYSFYVGSNNRTHKAEVRKAIRTLHQQNIKAFTIVKNALGYWENVGENSFIVQMIDTPSAPFNDDDARRVKLALKEQLGQYDVLTLKDNVEVLA